MHVLHRWKQLDRDLPGPEEVLHPGAYEVRERWLSCWSCSCQLEEAADSIASAGPNLVVFIYSEAEEALRRGFPFAADLAQPLLADDDDRHPTMNLRGPLRLEDAQRRQADEQQLHQLLLRHVQHHRSALEKDDEVTVHYARKRQRQQRREEAEQAGPDHGDVVVFVREDHEIVPHGQVWEGSVEMARWICAHYHERFRTGSGRVRPRVLELGSGCGLPGLVLAALGAQVTLSDRSEGALNNLVHNVGVNKSAFIGSSPPAVVHLDWAEPGTMRPVWPPPQVMVGSSSTDPRRFDFIVGTEVVYSEEGAEHLINTVKAWLRNHCDDLEHNEHDDHDAARSSFYLLQNPLRAGLEHFVGLLAGVDRQLADYKQELRRGLVLDELDSEHRPPPSPPLANEPGETEQLRLYRVTIRS